MTAAPEICVAIPSHNRALRLRWMLNSLEEQTLPRDRWEVVVAHDSSDDGETERLLREHPLAKEGVLRHITFEPGPGPADKRNAAWRAARAPLIAFTDDDCRAPEDWVQRALEAAQRHPGAIVQGMTVPDPDEREIKVAAAHARSQVITPPVPWAQTCNIVYPKDVLERVGGFDETLPLAAGEDTDLAIRARATGAEYVGAREVLTYHSVEAPFLHQHLRSAWRWQHLPYVVKRHPQIRQHQPFGIFWKPTHLWFPVAVASYLMARRRGPAWLVGAAPWLVHATPTRGSHPRGRIRALLELPGRAALDITEIAALARGSIRYRSLFL